MSSRDLSWNAALASLRADRAARLPVREERLRSAAGLRGTPALTLSAWRGQSGRRYVVGVHGLDAETLIEAGDCVALAVARDADGIASIRRVTADNAPSDVGAWIKAVRADGATEVHIHRLAGSDAERRAMIADLTDPVSVAA